MEEHKKEKLEKKVGFHCPTCHNVYQLIETNLGQKNQCLTNCLKKWREIVEEFHQKETLMTAYKEEQKKGNFLDEEDEK